MKKVEIEFIVTDGSTRRVNTTLQIEEGSLYLLQSTGGKSKLAESYKFMFPGASKVEIGLTTILD
jgi:hypothetical protein